jgi:hypothetical protein
LIEGLPPPDALESVVLEHGPLRVALIRHAVGLLTRLRQRDPTAAEVVQMLRGAVTGVSEELVAEVAAAAGQSLAAAGSAPIRARALDPFL